MLDFTLSLVCNLRTYTLLQEATPLTPGKWTKTQKIIQTIINSISECAKETCVAPPSLSLTPQINVKKASCPVNYKTMKKQLNMYHFVKKGHESHHILYTP